MGFLESLVSLVGHVAGSAVLFFTVALFAWLLKWAVHFLDSIHPFGPTIMGIFEAAEIGLLYLDICLSACVLLAGVVRFIKELIGGRRHGI